MLYGNKHIPKRKTIKMKNKLIILMCFQSRNKYTDIQPMESELNHSLLSRFFIANWKSMSEAKQKCQLNDCKRAASTLCYCCKKSICTQHFTEHIDAVRAQVNPLADAVNSMVEKIRGVTIEQFKEMPLAKLNQWKYDMHRLVDEVFGNKCKEIEDLVEKNRGQFHEYKTQQWENLMKIQDEMKQLVEDGDATFQQIELLKNQLARIEERQTVFETNFLSIRTEVFGNDLVTISSTVISPNISFTLAPLPTSTNLNFNALAHQPPALNALRLEAASTARVESNLQNNPFLVLENSSGGRPALKARRRRP